MVYPPLYRLPQKSIYYLNLAVIFQTSRMKILFLTPYPHGEAPSQRFRFEQYLPALEKAGYNYTLESFLDIPTWKILYHPGNRFDKAIGILKGFGRRIKMLLDLKKYDFVFIHREAAPIGPPVFEWAIAELFRKKIIYDFDDAIWLPNTSETNKIAAGLKWHHKVKAICRLSYKVSCGNNYLCNFALQFNGNVILNPTTIDTIHLHHPEKIPPKASDKPVIGWTGTHSTIPYLERLIPIIKKLEEKYDFEFRIISNSQPDWPLKSLVFKPWNKKTEIQDLGTFDIGLMPLTDDMWAKGKCGFKALQYMALEVATVASPVGVNTSIIKHGENGMLCSTLNDWEQTIETLLRQPELREKLGKSGRKKVVEAYSVEANTLNFLNLFY
jgi:glycosyltransferase involved in cell wall biosynthesis